MSLFIRSLKRHWFTTIPPVGPVSLAGQTVIVTGGNDGIGYQVAKQLAALHPDKLILASRNVSKSEAAIQQIRNAVDDSNTTMEAWKLDLGSIESVKKFAVRANRELERLDILVLNAGVMRAQFKLTADGHEETAQINFLSHSLLTLLLLPLLRKTAGAPVDGEPRIVAVGSGVYRFVKSAKRYSPNIIESLDDPLKFTTSDSYAISKFLGIVFLRELGKRLFAAKFPEDSRISVSSVCPGIVRTNLVNNYPGGIIGVTAARLFQLVMGRRVEDGARAIVHAAVSPQGKEYHGNFLLDLTPQTKMEGIVDTPEGRDLQARTWEEVYAYFQSISSSSVF